MTPGICRHSAKKSRFLFALYALIIVALLFVSSTLTAGTIEKRGIPVLTYHRFDPQKSGSTTVTTATFRSQLEWLACHHYIVVPLAIVVAMVQGHDLPPANAVAITVDDGHISVFTTLFPLILKYHVPVTLFVYPSAISHASYALTWEQLKEMKASGLVDIQAHTCWHPNFRKEKARMLPGDYKRFVMNQLVRSKAVLETRLGSPVTMMAWPYGIYDQELEQTAASAGYTVAFAYAGGAALVTSDLFAVPRIPVSNGVQGLAFAAMLGDAPSRSNEGVAHQQATDGVARRR